jgi:N-acetylmuramoyl-L-alanine amidase
MRRSFSGPLLTAIIAAVSASPLALAGGVYLHSATLDPQERSPTVVLALSSKVKARVYTLEKPHRVVVDLPGTRGAVGFHAPAARRPVTQVRTAERRGEGYRLVFELPGVRAAPQVSSQSGPGGYQLRIALTGAPAVLPVISTPATAASAASTAMAAATVVPAAPSGGPIRTPRPVHGPGSDGRDVIVAIDAGHGGEDPGAIGPGGTREKDVTLAIARALAAEINERPGMHAVLTRDSDRRIDLRDRFKRAQDAHANLFVSIHADSIRDRSVTGASVYTLSDHGASSEAARQLADRENAVLGGTALAGVDPALRSILVDASRSQIMGQSVEAADAVLSSLDRVGAVRKPVAQHAGFMVLKSPDFPSMLVETAYISNPVEERNLRSGSYQQRLAEAIESGVSTYFRQHPPDGTNYASARGSEGRVADDSGV